MTEKKITTEMARFVNEFVENNYHGGITRETDPFIQLIRAGMYHAIHNFKRGDSECELEKIEREVALDEIRELNAAVNELNIKNRARDLSDQQFSDDMGALNKRVTDLTSRVDWLFQKEKNRR